MQRMQRCTCIGMTVAVVLAATVGCGTGESEPERSHVGPPARRPPPAEPTADRESSPDRYDPGSAGQGPVVELDTSYGTIVLQLDPDHAPVTVRNFLSYVNEGHYDKTVFHYVDPGAIILGGGFSPALEPRDTSEPIRNEAHNGLKNRRGTVAMSRDFAHIDSATCQFFINLDDNPVFDHRSPDAEQYGYCVFGKVIEGMDVADKIGKSKLHDVGEFSSTPVSPVVIEAARERPVRR